MKFKLSLLILLSFSVSSLAGTKVKEDSTKRTPAATKTKTKKQKNDLKIICSNAQGDTGYAFVMVTDKDAKVHGHLSKNTIMGSNTIADLYCSQAIKEPLNAKDKMILTLECTDQSNDESYAVDYYSGGFAHHSMIDIFKGGTQLADNVFCQQL